MKAATVALLMGLVVVAAAAVGAEGRSKASAPAPAPSKDAECMSAVMNDMITCMDYIVVGGAEKRPNKACCNGTEAVLKEEGAQCLCAALAAAPDYGIQVDVARAAALPSLCHISHVPSLSKCLAAAEVPAAAPKPSHNSHHVSAPVPAPAKASSSVASVSYGLMAAVALLSLAFSV